MGATDKRKQSVYFSTATLGEIREAAIRLDRSLSWIVQKAWRAARTEIKRIPAAAGDRVEDRDVPEGEANADG